MGPTNFGFLFRIERNGAGDHVDGFSSVVKLGFVEEMNCIFFGWQRVFGFSYEA